jgi:hypothetical protein
VKEGEYDPGTLYMCTKIKQQSLSKFFKKGGRENERE